jgi:hypothetical protein
MARGWLWLACGLLLAAYLWSYYRNPPHVSVLQTSLERFQIDALLQKQPLVVEDRVADLRELQHAWFRTNFVSYATAVPGTWARVRSKWAVLHPREDAEILLCPASCTMTRDKGSAPAPHPDAHLIAVPLKARQLVVVPRNYHTHVTSDQVDVMLADDVLSWVAQKLT